MYILSLIGYIMIALLLMRMLAKARPRIKEPAPGKALKNLPMGLSSRFQLQRSSFMALLIGIVFGVVTGRLPLSMAGIVAAVALTTIFLPMRYTFTTKGISVGWSVLPLEWFYRICCQRVPLATDFWRLLDALQAKQQQPTGEQLTIVLWGKVAWKALAEDGRFPADALKQIIL